MSVKKIVNSVNTNDVSYQSNKPVSILNRPYLLGSLAFIIFGLLFSTLIYQRLQIYRQTQKKAVFDIANSAKDKLQQSLSYSLSAAKTLSFFINDDGVVKDFDSIASEILQTSKGIDALQLVPDGIIRNVYPLNGNEAVIGYDILKDSTRNKEAFKAIEKKEMFFAGPFQLKQGGVAVVGRLPVFRNDKFWGFSAVIIKMSTLLRSAGLDGSVYKGYNFQLSKINPDTGQEEFFIPDNDSLSKSQSVSVDVPDGEWKLSVARVGENKSFGDIILLAVLGFLFSMLGGISIYRFAIRPKKLSDLVEKQIVELKTSETNYRSLIERVSDAFVSLDKDWNYTYVNQKAGELFARTPESLIGKNIWKEFPEGIDKPFYHAYYRAMASQTYQYLNEYYEPYDKWFENHIYPSTDGLTIFFKDVTEIKQVSLALKENEEKYRSLIEQASDGIVITDLDGVILEANNSTVQITGFSFEELLGKHLYDFLPEEDRVLNPLRINELMVGKSLLYERRLLKKDGTMLEVEINSKMASTQSLIGFIRDITPRKKAEEKLQYQAILLGGVSDAITSLDMNRKIVSWNSSCEELYGFKTAEVLGKRIPELITFEYLNNNNEQVFSQVHKEGQWKGEFYFIHTKTNKRVYLLSSISLLRNKKDEIIGYIITSRDITDRKISEEEVKESNERFEMISRATNDVVWDHDFSKNETWGNKKLYDLYGIEEGKQKIDFEMFVNQIHPDDRMPVTKRLNKAIDKSTSYLTEEFRFKTANGEYRNFYDRAHIIYDNKGKPVRIIGAMQDITESENAKKAILQSEEKFRTIIEQALDGIFIADENAFFIEVNSAGCKMLGYSLTELQKIRFLDLIPAEDIAANPVRITTIEKGSSLINERRLIRKDGTFIDVEVSARRLLDGRYQSIARDITERKKVAEKLVEKEKKLQQVLASIADNFYVIDTNYNIVIINKVAERNLEIAWGKRVSIGTNLLDVIPGKGEEPIRENFEKAFAGEGIEYEMHLSHPDLPTCVLIQFSPVINESGRITGVSVIAKDISERKRTEELIRESEERYRALVENAPEALVVFDEKKLMFVNASESATRLFGMSIEDLLKIGPVDVSPKYQPDGRLSAEMAPVYIQKAINGEKPSFEWTHCKKSGELISCEVWLVRLPAENEVLIRGSIVDITERNEAKELLQKSYEDIRQLASNLQTIREDERTKMAREIHDELGQQLTGLKMDLHWLSRKVQNGEEDINKKIQGSIELINATIATVRKIATDLRPSILDDLGLLAALEWQGDEFEKRSGTKVLFINNAGELKVLPGISTELFRIYQELLTNIARHAKASLVTSSLVVDDKKLYFSIADNGIGFNKDSIANKRTLGLLGIKERTSLIGGTYEINSKPGKGSETIISIPLDIVKQTF